MRPATTGAASIGNFPVGNHRAHRTLVHIFGAVLTGVTLIALAIALAVLLTREPPSPEALLVFSVGVLGSLVLAAVRYDLLVALGMLLLAVVGFEPAPSDFIFGVAIAVALVSGHFEEFRVPSSVVWFATFFVALNLLSAVEVVDATRASFYLSITLYLLVFAVWLAVYVDSARKANLIAGTYIAAAAISALFATAALFASFPGHDLLVYGGSRAQGLFKDPNVYVSFLVPPALFVAEHAVAAGSSRMRRLLTSATFLTLVVGVLFSYSRAGWLNLTVGLLVLATLLFVRQEARRMLALTAILLAAGSVAFATVWITGSEDTLAQRTQLQQYDEQRFGAQLFGIEQSTRYPLGIGPGQFEVLSPLSAHSLYVRVLAEQGLFGLLTLLALLLVTLALAMGNASAGRDTYGIGSAALLAAWCGLLANSVFVDTLHWRHLWVVAALIWAGSARNRRPSSTGAGYG